MQQNPSLWNSRKPIENKAKNAMQSTTQKQERVNEQKLSVLVKQNSQERSESDLGTQSRSASTNKNTSPKRSVFGRTKENQDLKPFLSHSSKYKDTENTGLHSQKRPKTPETWNFKSSLGIRDLAVMQQACIRVCVEGNPRVRGSFYTNSRVYATVCKKNCVYKER